MFFPHILSLCLLTVVLLFAIVTLDSRKASSSFISLFCIKSLDAKIAAVEIGN